MWFPGTLHALANRVAVRPNIPAWIIEVHADVLSSTGNKIKVLLHLDKHCLIRIHLQEEYEWTGSTALEVRQVVL